MRSYEGDQQQNDDWGDYSVHESNAQQEEDIDPEAGYDEAMNSVHLMMQINNIPQSVLTHHRITASTSAHHTSFTSKVFTNFDPEGYIAVQKTLHYGIHYVYVAIFGQYRLEINVLNLHRSSDDRDETITKQEIGSGSYGSVRSMIVGTNQLAVKRINFVSKIDRISRFDYETQKAERHQIRRAIREYCIYKICSMFKIGPEVIFRTNYDLICFNNCIEFTMELCKIPNKDPLFMKSRGLTLQKLQKDLFENLKMMHALKLVHKDIKPDNIVYSQSRGRFVFTDFGLAHTVNENSDEKSLSHFAGTDGYCSKQMKELLNKGQGLVNLYHNDYCGVRLSIMKFQEDELGGDSFSHNKFSFRNQYLEHREDQSGSECSIDRYEGSWDDSTPFSYSSGSKFSTNDIYLSSTTSLLGPDKNASLINYFQSEILFQIFRNKKDFTKIDILQLHDILEKKKSQIKDQTIFQYVQRYLKNILFSTDANSLLTFYIVELKNSARHYGPKSQKAIECIDKVLASMDLVANKDIKKYFLEIKDEILSNKQVQSIHNFQTELKLHRNLRNFDYISLCTLRILREMVAEKPKYSKQNPVRWFSMLIFITKVFIFCNKIDTLRAIERCIMNEQYMKLFEEEEEIEKIREDIHNSAEHYFPLRTRKNEKTEFNCKITTKLNKFALNFLGKNNKLDTMDLYYAFRYQLKSFLIPDEKELFFYLLRINQIQLEQQLIPEKFFSKMTMKLQIYSILIIMFPALSTCQQQFDRLFLQLETKATGENRVYFLYAVNIVATLYTKNTQYLKARQMILANITEIQALVNTDFDKINLLLDSRKNLGVSYFWMDQYELALKHFLEAKRIILCDYGMDNLNDYYQEMSNNIGFCFVKLGRYEEALQEYEKQVILLNNSQNSNVVSKALLYRAIIVLYLKRGLKVEYYPVFETHLKNMVRETMLSICHSVQTCKGMKDQWISIKIFNFLRECQDIETETYVLNRLVSVMEPYVKELRLPYEQINYRLYKIYSVDLQMPRKSLLYIWNYLKLKTKDFKGVESTDYQLMNNFVRELTKFNSSRRALIFMRKYIFHIPLKAEEIRKEAFRIYNHLHRLLGHPWTIITSELVVDDCDVLFTHNYQRIYQKKGLENNVYKIKLVEKWICRL